MTPAGTALGRILPACVETEECFGDPTGGTLLPGEQSAVAGAVAVRRREYSTVRACARVCLERLGHPPVAIPRGAGGAPVWPVGVRGSLTHCVGYAAAAVGPADLVSSIGIDAEPDLPLPEGVLDVVATRAELQCLRRMPATPDSPHWDRLLFSAKEAVYKAWFPLVGEWLDPQETEIFFTGPGDAFTAALARQELAVDGCPVTRLHGRWTRARGILVTAVALVRG
jgi:enterobactin synthetase component D / holo-[acyl-carrier protein] synthase